MIAFPTTCWIGHQQRTNSFQAQAHPVFSGSKCFYNHRKVNIASSLSKREKMLLDSLMRRNQCSISFRRLYSAWPSGATQRLPSH